MPGIIEGKAHANYCLLIGFSLAGGSFVLLVVLSTNERATAARFPAGESTPKREQGPANYQGATTPPPGSSRAKPPRTPKRIQRGSDHATPGIIRERPQSDHATARIIGARPPRTPKRIHETSKREQAPCKLLFAHWIFFGGWFFRSVGGSFDKRESHRRTVPSSCELTTAATVQSS